MTRCVNLSISHPTPFVKTFNEKLKWNTNVNVRMMCMNIRMWYSSYEGVML
jgi:hypothetical protein